MEEQSLTKVAWERYGFVQDTVFNTLVYHLNSGSPKSKQPGSKHEIHVWREKIDQQYYYQENIEAWSEIVVFNSEGSLFLYALKQIGYTDFASLKQLSDKYQKLLERF